MADVLRSLGYYNVGGDVDASYTRERIEKYITFQMKKLGMSSLEEHFEAPNLLDSVKRQDQDITKLTEQEVKDILTFIQQQKERQAQFERFRQQNPNGQMVAFCT